MGQDTALPASPRSQFLLSREVGKDPTPPAPLVSSSGRGQQDIVENLEAPVQEKFLYEPLLHFLMDCAINQSDYMQRQKKSRSLAFVCFQHQASDPYAIALLNGICLYGRTINV